MEEVTSTEFQEDAAIPNAEATPQADPTNAPAIDGGKLNTNFYQRTKATFLMLSSFVVILTAGQFYCFLLIQFLNYLIFSEINSIKRNQEKQANIPITKYLNWYIFGIVNYLLLGGFIANKFPILGVQYEVIGKLLHYHSFICFTLFTIGFLMFVLSLKQGYLKYQFRLFGWIVIAAILVCFQAWLLTHNLFEGLIWFLVPALLVVCNDIFAYLFGYFFGKHQLIALSPKKTWEGYIGGAISTCLFSIIITDALQTMDGIACPLLEPSIMPFTFPACIPTVLNVIDLGFITLSNLQVHMMIMSLFASTIGPFGGFFASGLKRSIKIKDFANSIPGHGGVSDRMDCQVIMGTFVYFYFQTFVKVGTVTATTYLLGKLNPQEQLTLYHELQRNLQTLGLI